MNTTPELDQVLARLETRVRRMQLLWCATMLASLSALGWACLGSRSSPEVIRVRGIVVEDVQGKPRLLLGAPIPEVAERVRKDAASGLVVLDAAGVERLQIGNVGGPMMGGKVQPRIADAVG
jgi:hypothetical protein